MSTKAGTLGGMLTVLFANINSADIVKTAVLSATGAAVSYIISQALRWIVNRRKRMTSQQSSIEE